MAWICYASHSPVSDPKKSLIRCYGSFADMTDGLKYF